MPDWPPDVVNCSASPRFTNAGDGGMTEHTAPSNVLTDEKLPSVEETMTVVAALAKFEARLLELSPIATISVIADVQLFATGMKPTSITRPRNGTMISVRAPPEASALCEKPAIKASVNVWGWGSGIVTFTR